MLFIIEIIAGLFLLGVVACWALWLWQYLL